VTAPQVAALAFALSTLSFCLAWLNLAVCSSGYSLIYVGAGLAAIGTELAILGFLKTAAIMAVAFVILLLVGLSTLSVAGIGCGI
jgi:hypothetical protein